MKKMASLNISKYKNDNQFAINNKFSGACRRGDLAVIQLLLDSKEVIFKPELDVLSQLVFTAACKNNNLEFFHYLEHLYNSKSIIIKLPHVSTYCRYVEGELFSYLHKFYSSLEIEEAFNYLFINGNIEKLKILKKELSIDFSQAELEKYFKMIVVKSFGSSDAKISWILLEESLTVSVELRRWLNEQTPNLNTKKAVELISKIDFKDKIEEMLVEKTTIKNNIKI